MSRRNAYYLFHQKPPESPHSQLKHILERFYEWTKKRTVNVNNSVLYMYFVLYICYFNAFLNEAPPSTLRLGLYDQAYKLDNLL